MRRRVGFVLIIVYRFKYYLKGNIGCSHYSYIHLYLLATITVSGNYIFSSRLSPLHSVKPMK